MKNKQEKANLTQPHILVTNDDGVDAPGLLALAQALQSCGRVSIVAPDRDWSGRGHVKTLSQPLRVKTVQLTDTITALTTDGAPSDCVAMALMGLLPDKVDLVVSGINPMANVGHDVTYSGTVTAIMEATIFNIPGIAVSIDGNGLTPSNTDYENAARIARVVVRDWLQKGLPSGTFLNVNIPHRPIHEIYGIRATRLGQRVYRDKLEQRTDPHGRQYYWIGGELPTGIAEEGTDLGALADGYVSITPMKLDMTAYSALNEVTEWDWAVLANNKATIAYPTLV